MNILICGGAGYIGSHTLKYLRALNHHCLVVDNLSTGFEWAALGAPFYHVDILDKPALDKVFAANKFDVVMHFCARSLVGESVEKPGLYYENNVSGTLTLLQSMLDHGVKNLVFSSTAAIFGEPQAEVIDEHYSKAPLNPYGKTKLMIEQVLQDYAVAYGLNSVALRYFNAAGADPDAELGEAHNPETHLIPNILKSLLVDADNTFKVFGNDYPTHDGTCIRDYIHVNDLAAAHVLAMEYLDNKPGFHAFNLGNKTGYSIMELMQACEKVSGKKVKYELAERRPGDPAKLVADNSLAAKELGWQAQYTSIESIIETAWRWHQTGQAKYTG